jgi:hypothetical protein
VAACSPANSGEAEPAFETELQEQLSPTDQPEKLETATAVAPSATPVNEDIAQPQDPVTSFNETREASGAADVRQEPEEHIPATIENSPNSPFVEDDIVTGAKNDLSEKLGVPVADIQIFNYEEVIWPDGSLGCPKPKNSYIQVIQEGYHLELIVADQVYDYHGAQGELPIFCDERPNQPEIPPLPGSQND